MTHGGGGEVMFNADLIFRAGVPLVVLEWERHPHEESQPLQCRWIRIIFAKEIGRTRNTFTSLLSKTLVLWCPSPKLRRGGRKR